MRVVCTCRAGADHERRDSIASFGFNAGYRTEESPLQGHPNYIDHNTGMHVTGTNADEYTGWSTNDRAFHGDANVNGEPGFTYLVEVIDNGEPGRQDLFRIAVSNGYCANSNWAEGGAGCVFFDFDGMLEGGNIQIHKAEPCN